MTFGASVQMLVAARGCRVVFAILIALYFGLTATPQAVDVLITLGQNDSVLAWLGFAFSTGWLAANTWFWARFGFQEAHRERHGPGAPQLPGLLAAASLLIVAYALAAAASRVPASMGSLGGNVRLDYAAAIVAVAGALVGVASLRGRDHPTVASGAYLGQRLTTAGWRMLALSFFVGLVGLAGFSLDPVRAASLAPPASTVMFAASGLMCGGTLLLHVGRRTRIPVLLLVCLFGLTLGVLRDGGALPDNHDLRRLAAPIAIRPDLEATFLQFLSVAEAPQGRVPVVLVAASGGGVAAAYWSATVLGDLADASPAFARSVFAMSGVSGGALGLLAYTASGPARPECRDPAALADAVQPRTRRACLQLALSGDFMGPTLGAMLYPDLLQRFVPLPLFSDRATALEHAWEHRWQSVFGNERLSQAFLTLWSEQQWPALLLNATSFNRGGRLVISNLALDADHVGGDGADLLRKLGSDLPASAAAGATARFPVVGPLGNFRDVEGAQDAVVDGGYFENLGASTLLELLDVLAATAREHRYDVRFVVIQLINNPSAGSRPISDRVHKSPWSLLPRGLTGPVSVLLRTREARGVSASEALARRVMALGGSYLPVRLGLSPTGQTAPLGWSLSAVAQDFIDGQWTPKCRGSLLAEAGFPSEYTENLPSTADHSSAARMDVMAMWSVATCASVGSARHGDRGTSR